MTDASFAHTVGTEKNKKGAVSLKSEIALKICTQRGIVSILVKIHLLRYALFFIFQIKVHTDKSGSKIIISNSFALLLILFPKLTC